MKPYLPINRKGFVSTYFLCIFLFVITATSILLINLKTQMQTYEQTQKLHPYLQAETAVISYVKNHLANNDLEDASVTYNTYAFDLRVQEDKLLVYLSEPVVETLMIEYKENQVIDYTVIRNIQ